MKFADYYLFATMLVLAGGVLTSFWLAYRDAKQGKNEGIDSALIYVACALGAAVVYPFAILAISVYLIWHVLPTAIAQRDWRYPFRARTWTFRSDLNL
jgi:hypothetical protein